MDRETPTAMHHLMPTRTAIALRDRLQFWLEQLIMRGAVYRLSVIAGAIGLITLLGGLAGSLVDKELADPLNAFWWAFLRLTDPGYLGDDEGVGRRVVSAALTVLGYVVFMGALIAIMTQWLHETMRRLEQGFTPISMRGHVLLLGWTSRTPDVVRDIVASPGLLQRFLTGRHLRRLRVVILSEEVTSASYAELRDHLGLSWLDESFILRTGSALREDHLRRVDYLRAAVIVLPGGTAGQNKLVTDDTRAIKTLMSVAQGAREARLEKRLPLMIAAIDDVRKIAIARQAYPGPLEIIASRTISVRMLAQGLRHWGVTLVYAELLTDVLQGNSIYTREIPQNLHGRHFSQVAIRNRRAVPLGVVRRVGEGYDLLSKADGDYTIEPGDRLVYIARSYDDGAMVAAEERRRPQLISQDGESPAEPRPRRLLVLGWSASVAALLVELASARDEVYTVAVMSRIDPARREAETRARLGTGARIDVRHVVGDATLSDDLAAACTGESFDTVLVASIESVEDEGEADARTLSAYLALRHVYTGVATRPRVLLEMNDAENARLVDDPRDMVQVNASVISHMLAQVALRRELNRVYEELFSAGGNEFVMLPAASYGLQGSATSFGAVEELAHARDEIALGFFDAARGVMHLNPPREEAWTPGPNDQVLVLTTV